LRALEIAGNAQGVKIYSDSKYSIQCVTEWYAAWERNGWQTRDGPVKNVDLVQAIRKRITARDKKGVRTVLEWVKGHASNAGNVAADQLAVQGSRY
jgi:ribonuclease HI